MSTTYTDYIKKDGVLKELQPIVRAENILGLELETFELQKIRANDTLIYDAFKVKHLNIVVINFDLRTVNPLPKETHNPLFTVPSGYRPKTTVYTAGTTGVNGWMQIGIYGDGSTVNGWSPNVMLSPRGTIIYRLA